MSKMRITSELMQTAISGSITIGVRMKAEKRGEEEEIDEESQKRNRTVQTTK